MTAWWKRSLAGQFISFMLIALFAAQAIGFAISWSDRQRALRESAQSEFLSRAVTMTQVLEGSPASLREDVLLASATTYSRFWIDNTVPDDVRAWYGQASAQLQKPLPNLVHFSAKNKNNRDYHSGGIEDERAKGLAEDVDTLGPWKPLPSVLWPLTMPAQYMKFSRNDGLGLVITLSDGTRLNAAYYKPLTPDIWKTQTLLSIALTVVIIAVIGAFFANRIARPLRALSQSAEALGRGEAALTLPETGPDDIRLMCEAFNRMQLRLRRFVEDRTRMLAAISHDLRTPLTTLRLRAEFVTDEDLQQKMLSTIDEIQTMTEATLSFAKGEATVEETRTVELNSLVGSLCDDLVELGHKVEFTENGRIDYRCRPDALRRAFRNLIENAVRYGGQALVTVLATPTTIDVVVADKGPSIPDDQLEQVFAPFYRLEGSRSRETGGVGLGLSIARAIIRHHGGDIQLSQNQPGLRATIMLPRA